MVDTIDHTYLWTIRSLRFYVVRNAKRCFGLLVSFKFGTASEVPNECCENVWSVVGNVHDCIFLRVVLVELLGIYGDFVVISVG